MKDTWIFQADPDQFRIDGLLATAAGQRIIYDDLKYDPILSNMQILRAGIGTNFPFKNEYAARLAPLWPKNGQQRNHCSTSGLRLLYNI